MQILSSLPHASILWYPAPPLGYLNCFEFQFFAPPSLCYCCQLFSSSQSLKWPFLSPSGRRQWHPTTVLLPGKFHGWRCLVGCSPWGLLRVRHDWVTSLSCIGEGNGKPLQCSSLENPRDAEAWWAAIYGVPQSRTRLKWLSSSSSHLLSLWNLWIYKDF